MMGKAETGFTRPLLALSVAVLSGALLPLAPGARAAEPSGEPYLLGMIAPTTGPLTTVGIRQLQAVQWWERTANATGGINDRPVQVMHCNDEGSPDKSVTCARDLIGQGSLLLLNASVTGPIRAAMPLVKNGPVMVTPSPNIVPGPDTYVFQTSPTDVDLTRAIADWLRAGKATDLAMLAATDASGEVGVASAKEVFPAASIKYALARIDLRANDASIQLAKVATPEVKAVYSSYSGGGAATVVKSFANLGLDQPLIVSYANLSDAFINVIKNDMPKRLLGTGLKAVSPELLADAGRRTHVENFIASYRKQTNDSVDQLTLLGLTLADTADAVLRNVGDPKDANAVRTYLETHPVLSVAEIRWSKDRHVGLTHDDVAVLEYKGGRWVKADPVQ
jgi:branched-chain amino acid transport system substrate-binding protein